MSRVNVCLASGNIKLFTGGVSMAKRKTIAGQRKETEDMRVRAERALRETEALRRKKAFADKTFEKLMRSIALKILWPEAYEGDDVSVTSYWFGKDVPPGYRITRPKHKHHEFVMHRREGESVEERRFHFDDVPELLGGGLKVELEGEDESIKE
jgi:hypothetical protein